MVIFVCFDEGVLGFALIPFGFVFCLLACLGHEMWVLCLWALPEGNDVKALQFNHLTPLHWTEIIIPSDMIPPPAGKRHRRPTRSKHSKRQDEQHCQTRSIPCPCHQVRVILEDPWSVVPEVELDEEPSNQLRKDHTGLRGIIRDVPSILNELREVDLPDRKSTDLWFELN